MPGCFPDLKGVLWLGLCLGTVELLARTLIFLFGATGRQEAVPSRVPGCFPDLKGVLWLGFCA